MSGIFLNSCLYRIDEDAPFTTLPFSSNCKSTTPLIKLASTKPNLFICNVLALIPGELVSPLNISIGAWLSAITEDIPVTAEKDVIVTLHDADVEE